MKKTIVLLVCCLFSAALFAQKPLDGFKQDKSGIWYKFEKKNDKGTPVKTGDVIVGNFAVKFGDSVAFDGMKNPPQPMFMVGDQYRVLGKGDLMDGLLLMKKGEVCSFAFTYDSISKVQQVPDHFKKGMYAYFKISIEDLRTEESLMKEQEEAMLKEKEVADSMFKIESVQIESAVKAFGIEEKSENGIYIKRLSSGNGNVLPKDGDKVSVHYAGRFLDGTLFDTSIEEVAKQENNYQPGRKYEPIEFIIGKGMMIPGFEKGVITLKQGDRALVLMPSAFAYGSRGSGSIAPYTPIMFEVELVDIKNN